MPPRTGDPAVPNYEQSIAELAVAVRVLMGSQAQFMRSAASADPCIGISLSTPLLPSEELDAQAIDNTVEDGHRNGLSAGRRDYRPLMPTFPTHLALLNEIRAMGGAPRAVGPFSAKSTS